MRKEYGEELKTLDDVVDGMKKDLSEGIADLNSKQDPWLQ